MRFLHLALLISLAGAKQSVIDALLSSSSDQHDKHEAILRKHFLFTFLHKLGINVASEIIEDPSIHREEYSSTSFFRHECNLPFRDHLQDQNTWELILSYAIQLTNLYRNGLFYDSIDYDLCFRDKQAYFHFDQLPYLKTHYRGFYTDQHTNYGTTIVHPFDHMVNFILPYTRGDPIPLALTEDRHLVDYLLSFESSPLPLLGTLAYERMLLPLHPWTLVDEIYQYLKRHFPSFDPFLETQVQSLKSILDLTHFRGLHWQENKFFMPPTNQMDWDKFFAQLKPFWVESNLEINKKRDFSVTNKNSEYSQALERSREAAQRRKESCQPTVETNKSTVRSRASSWLMSNSRSGSIGPVNNGKGTDPCELDVLDEVIKLHVNPNQGARDEEEELLRNPYRLQKSGALIPQESDGQSASRSEKELQLAPVDLISSPGNNKEDTLNQGNEKLLELSDISFKSDHYGLFEEGTETPDEGISTSVETQPASLVHLHGVNGPTPAEQKELTPKQSIEKRPMVYLGKKKDVQHHKREYHFFNKKTIKSDNKKTKTIRHLWNKKTTKDYLQSQNKISYLPIKGSNGVSLGYPHSTLAMTIDSSSSGTSRVEESNALQLPSSPILPKSLSPPLSIQKTKTPPVLSDESAKSTILNFRTTAHNLCKKLKLFQNIEFIQMICENVKALRQSLRQRMTKQLPKTPNYRENFYHRDYDAASFLIIGAGNNLSDFLLSAFKGYQEIARSNPSSSTLLAQTSHPQAPLQREHLTIVEEVRENSSLTNIDDENSDSLIISPIDQVRTPPFIRGYTSPQRIRRQQNNNNNNSTYSFNFSLIEEKQAERSFAHSSLENVLNNHIRVSEKISHLENYTDLTLLHHLAKQQVLNMWPVSHTLPLLNARARDSKTELFSSWFHQNKQNHMFRRFGPMEKTSRNCGITFRCGWGQSSTEKDSNSKPHQEEEASRLTAVINQSMYHISNNHYLPSELKNGLHEVYTQLLLERSDRRFRTAEDNAIESIFDSFARQYHWILEHPILITVFSEISVMERNNEISVLLDHDERFWAVFNDHCPFSEKRETSLSGTSRPLTEKEELELRRNECLKSWNEAMEEYKAIASFYGINNMRYPSFRENLEKGLLILKSQWENYSLMDKSCNSTKKTCETDLGANLFVLPRNTFWFHNFFDALAQHEGKLSV